MDLFTDRFSFINIEIFTQNLLLVPNVQSNNLYPYYNRQQQGCEDEIGHLVFYFFLVRVECVRQRNEVAIILGIIFSSLFSAICSEQTWSLIG